MNNIIFKTLLLKGEAGNNIVSVEKTATNVLVDTYTITLTDGSTTTFEVTNGKSIVSIEKTATSGLTDTYTITYNDETTSTFTVVNGSSISSIAKTATVGLVDTYTVTLTDGSTTTFEVTNGADGRGITSIEKTATVGLVDTYTITYTDGTTSTFNVTNSNGGTWTTPVACLVGDTTCTISDVSILTTSVIDVYAENASGKVQGISSVAVTTGQAVISFDALTEATSFKLHIINL